MMRQVLGMWVMLLACAPASPATNAGFRVEGAPVAPGATAAPAGASCTDIGLHEVGERPALRSLLMHGDDQDVRAALRSVLPLRDGWTLRGDAQARSGAFGGGKPWPDIADSIARQAGVCLTLNWRERTLVIDGVVPKAAPAPSTSSAAIASTTAPHSDTATPSRASEVPLSPATAAAPSAPVAPSAAHAAVADSPPPSAPVHSYTLKAGDTVRITFARWCKAAGWTLVWNADMDYPVEVAMSFPVGTELREAVKEVLRAYWNQPYALEGHVYSNQVLEIVGRSR